MKLKKLKNGTIIKEFTPREKVINFKEQMQHHRDAQGKTLNPKTFNYRKGYINAFNDISKQQKKQKEYNKPYKVKDSNKGSYNKQTEQQIKNHNDYINKKMGC